MRLERSIPAEALDAIRAPLLAAGATATDAPVLQPLGLLLDIPSWINLRSFKLIVLFTVLMLGTHGLLMALAPAASLQQEPQRRKRSILELP